MLFRKKPEEVFTPRAPEVNERMYVPRGDLEREITKALNGSYHFIIHGESGNGKSWLYKKVFKEKNVPFFVANLATALSTGNLDDAFIELIERDKAWVVTSTEKTSSKGMKPKGMGVDWETLTKIEKSARSPFERMLAKIRKAAGRWRAVVVFDNFEQVVRHERIVEQIAACIVLLDDANFASYDVKIALVGVPSDIRELVARHGHADTVSNRLIEVPEVARLTRQQARSLLEKGFEKELGLTVSEPDSVYDEIMWLTDRIAQQLHDLGLQCALAANETGTGISKDVVEEATRSWVNQSLSSQKSIIEGRMNVRDTKAGRRNQVIYAVGNCDDEDFKPTYVEDIVRDTFPRSTRGLTLNIGQNLSDLSKGENPILKKNPKENSYRFSHPKLRMAIRALLQVTPSEKVEKAPQIK